MIIDTKSCEVARDGAITGYAEVKVGDGWASIEFTAQAVFEHHPTETMDGYVIWQAYSEIVDFINLEYTVETDEPISDDKVIAVIEEIVFSHELGAVA